MTHDNDINCGGPRRGNSMNKMLKAAWKKEKSVRPNGDFSSQQAQDKLVHFI